MLGGAGKGARRLTRVIGLAAATTPVFFVLAAAAGAATYFVQQGGTGSAPCAQADPCGSIQEGVDAHRLSPQPDDVVAVGPGDYLENVDATDPADEGLTIRGSLGGGGNPDTEIHGTGATGAAGCVGCIVTLGASPDTDVTLENAEVDQQGTDVDSDLVPIQLAGGSDLTTVDAEVIDTNTFAAVELCADPGSVLTDSILDSTGTNAAGLDGCAAVTIVDSAIFTDDGTGVDVPGTPGETTEITRSWVSAADSSPGAAVTVDGDFTLDSSLVTGANAAVNLPGNTAAAIQVNNSTIDAATPGIDDAVPAIFLGRAGTDPIDATIDSTIIVDQLTVDFPGAPLALTCVYTNFTDMSTPVDTTGFTNDCPDGTQPGSTNTLASPGDIFEDALFGDWSLQAGSPAIDAGQPGPVPAGFSTTDIEGDQRRQAGTAATCPDGVRDQGAFEAPGVACTKTLTVSTTGTGAGTVTGPGIDCGGEGHTDCTQTVPSGAQIELTATAAANSRFDGFTGAGCSASPCTVTLDANRSVTARFSGVSANTRTISLYSDKPRVRPRRFVSLYGQVFANEADCVANQTVQLLRKRQGDKDFDVFRTVKTDASGRYTRTITVNRPPREFRAQVLPSATCVAAESDTVEVRKRKRR